jgi:membrane protein implicated in regulation of membrane protease activity
MTAFATMLALVPLAVIGGGGGIGGAFISRPLAIVVIGGLFTSTVLTLVLVPVLYSLVSRFASRRSTKDLDDLLDAAQERRFKPIGSRGSALAAAASGDGAGRTFSVSVLLEPEPGRQGDPAVLQRLASSGLSIAPVTGSAQFTITIANVAAESEAAAKQVAVSTIKGMLPREGYVVSNPEVHVEEGPVAAATAQVSA